MIGSNKLVQYVHETASVRLTFVASQFPTDGEARGVAVADSSLNNVDDVELGAAGEKVRSQLGFMCCLCGDDLFVDGEGGARTYHWLGKYPLKTGMQGFVGSRDPRVG